MCAPLGDRAGRPGARRGRAAGSPRTWSAGTIAHLPALDPLIAAQAQHWRLERMAVIDRLILRMAVYEFLHRPDTPRTVVINEAIELARTFSERGGGAVRERRARRHPSRHGRRRHGRRMSEDNELYQQRRANLAELQRLGVEPYPRTFDRTDTVSALVAAHGERSAADLEALRPETTTAGRILAIRSFGKANFLVLSDGVARIQVYIRAGLAAGARLPGLQAARLRRLRRRARAACSGRRRTS